MSNSRQSGVLSHFPPTVDNIHPPYKILDLTIIKEATKAAGPQSFEDSIQKGALLGQKVLLNLWYVNTRPKAKYDRRSNAREQFFSNLAWYRRTKDLVPLFDQKGHLLENSLQKIVAQL